MEQRQPVLHALMLAAGRNRLVERIVSCDRTEQLHVALAEGAAHVRRERKLAHRQEFDGIQSRRRALRVRIEGSDRFQGVAEEIESDGLSSRRIKVENAAAHRVLPGIGDRARPPIA